RALPDARDGRRRRRHGRPRRERDAGAGDSRRALGGGAGLGPCHQRRPARDVQRDAARLPHCALRLRGARGAVQSRLVWLLFALPAALFQVLRNASMKRLGHALDEYINVWGRFTFLLPWALLACVVGGFPTLKPGFYAWCLPFGVTQTLATLAVLVTDTGQRYTLLAAFFYARSVITIKQATLASDAAMGTLGCYLAASLIVSVLALRTSARHFRAIPRYWKEFVSLGLFAALTTILQAKAYTMTLSSYVEAAK